MNLDFSRCRLAPFAHQREDVAWLLDRPYAFICSEMRTGKSKIVIDAAQFLYEAGVIDRVIVVAPAPVRDVWYDPTLGELAKHLWNSHPAIVTEYHARNREWFWMNESEKAAPSNVLQWFVTNYEFLRAKNRLIKLLAVCGPKTMLVLDESSFVKSHATHQTKACLQLRRACGRVVLLNGTPIFHSPLDLFSQGNILHKSVLDCQYITHFKAKYAVMQPVLGWGGRPLKSPRGWGNVQKVIGWTNLPDLQRRFAPITVRRLQAECLDLPPKLDPVALTATLDDTTWQSYKDMRDDLVVWLQGGNVATSATAAVKALRLSQITSGFLGGIEESGVDDAPTLNIEGVYGEPALKKVYGSLDQIEDEMSDLFVYGSSTMPGVPIGILGNTDVRVWRDVNKAICPQVQEIGREKLDVLLWFVERRLEADPNAKIVAWCRFRAELFRMVDAVRGKFPQFLVAAIHGGQKRAERLRALSLLKPETAPPGPVFVGGIEGTGSFGLDMTASHTCVTMSSGYSPGRSAQTLDRVFGPGQTQPISYHSILAVGPRGQKTIDHQIEAARRAGENVASWTTAAWVKALTEE